MHALADYPSFWEGTANLGYLPKAISAKHIPEASNAKRKISGNERNNSFHKMMIK